MTNTAFSPDRSPSKGFSAIAWYRSAPVHLQFAGVTTCLIALVMIASTTTLVIHREVGTHATALLHKAFWVDQETNIATLFAFSLLAMASLLTSVLAFFKVMTGERWRFYWVALGAILLFMAYDEAAQVHEKLGPPIRQLTGASGALYFAWVIPGMIGVLGIAGIYLRMVLSLPAYQRNLILVSGAVFVFGAIGMEMVGSFIFDGIGRYTVAYAIATTLEETFEMLGVMIFCTAILSLIEATPLAQSFRRRPT
ncbi:hypothetical protein [Palleronia aestuarii]|nr:hypothetical protein [Palleronia aestuarii]